MESGTWYLDLIFLGLSPFCFWLQKFDEESMGEEEGSQGRDAVFAIVGCLFLVFGIWFGDFLFGFGFWSKKKKRSLMRSLREGSLAGCSFRLCGLLAQREDKGNCGEERSANKETKKHQSSNGKPTN